jgi:hypothetical protein
VYSTTPTWTEGSRGSNRLNCVVHIPSEQAE